MAYIKQNPSTGDVITQTLLRTMETQYEKAVLLENNEFYQGKHTGGTAYNLLGVNTSNQLVLGPTSGLDTHIQAGASVSIRPAGTEVLLLASSGLVKATAGNIEIEQNSPRLILDREGGAGQYGLIEVYDGATLKADFGYDYTNNEFRIRDGSANVRMRMLMSNGILISEHHAKCRAYRTTNQSINSGADTAIALDAEDWDNDSMHSTVSNTSRITINTGGRYYVHGQAMWASSGTDGIRQLSIKLNGSQVIANNTKYGLTNDVGLIVSTIIDLYAADYLELFAFQSIGSALNIAYQAEYSPIFTAEYLGPV